MTTTADSPGMAPASPLHIPGLDMAEPFHSRVLQQPLAAPRFGIMLHYDDSASDDSSLTWFHDPRCTNGYTWIVLREGRLVELADPAMRTPHAGACLTPNANSVFYGLAAATNARIPASPRQFETIVACCRALFAYHRWDTSEAVHRIVGHDAQAIWSKANTSDETLWGKLGRKVDPTGQRRDGTPIVDVAEVRRRLGDSATRRLGGSAVEGGR
jgi:N-acetyl-anhydromuramyl-L-alanine amidase AmpD